MCAASVGPNSRPSLGIRIRNAVLYGEGAMNYADRLRDGEDTRRMQRGRFSRRELAAMREQTQALLHLAETGWLPDRRHQPEQPRLIDQGEAQKGA